MCGERCRLLCSQWRLWIRPLVFVLYGAIILGFVPYLIYTLVSLHAATTEGLPAHSCLNPLYLC